MGLCNSIYDRKLRSATIDRYFSYDGKKLKARIVEVYDGDTCTAIFRQNGNSGPLIKYKIRLIGIDSPELKPRLICPNREKIIENAKASKKVVEDKILGRIVTLECGGFDKYGRILATIHVGSCNLNEWLLEEGYAKSYDGGKKDEEVEG